MGDENEGARLPYRGDMEAEQPQWTAGGDSSLDMPLSCFEHSPLSMTSPEPFVAFTPADNKGWNYFDRSCQPTTFLPPTGNRFGLPPHEDSPAMTQVPYAYASPWNADEQRIQREQNMSPIASSSQYSDYGGGSEGLQTPTRLAPNPWVWQSSSATQISPSYVSSSSATPTSTETTAYFPAGGGLTPSPRDTKDMKDNATPARRNNREKGTRKKMAQPQAQTQRRSSRTMQTSQQQAQAQLSPHLRTAETPRRFSTSKAKSPSTSNTETTDKNRSHNQVEKQYRQRLNGHFAALLDMIPREVIEAGSGAGVGVGAEGKVGVSKAETLILAKRYIGILQREEKKLGEKNGKLRGEMEGFKMQWVRAGGVIMP